MKILLTNDDGLYGEGLRYLAEWSRQLGEVFIAAPKYEQSGRSQGIVIHEPYEVVESDAFADLGISAISVDASPADCVRFVADRMGVDFDFVFSGINNGYNLGHDIAYSGTCGAAFEANYAGIKAASFSTIRGNTKQASAYLSYVWDYITSNSIFDHCGMLNVNIPEKVGGVLLTEQGKTFFRDHFIDAGENMYKADVYLTRDVNGPLDLRYDTDAVLAGYCSVTPLLTNRTDRTAIEKLSAIKTDK